MHAADVNKITETLNSKDSFITCHSKNFVSYIKEFLYPIKSILALSKND